MERDDRVPIEETEEPAGLEERDLVQSALGGLRRRLDQKLKQGFAGKLHFGAQTEAAIAIKAGDAPEVESFSIADRLRIATAAAEAGSADEPVEPAA